MANGQLLKGLMNTETENWVQERCDKWLHSSEAPNYGNDGEESERCGEICRLIDNQKYEQALALILAHHLTYF